MSSFVDILNFRDVTAIGDTLTANYELPSYMGNSFNLEQAVSMDDVIGARNRGEVIGFLKFMAKSCYCDIRDIVKIDLVEVDYRIGTVSIVLADNTTSYSGFSGFSGFASAGGRGLYGTAEGRQAWRDFFNK